MDITAGISSSPAMTNPADHQAEERTPSERWTARGSTSLGRLEGDLVVHGDPESRTVDDWVILAVMYLRRRLLLWAELANGCDGPPAGIGQCAGRDAGV